MKDAFKKYYMTIGANKWTFATNQKSKNPLKLLRHISHISNTVDYVRVKGDKSPFDGNLVYWSTRMGNFHNMPTSKAIKLKKQKGKCNWCGLQFREGDILEEDHVIATALGGKNVHENLQLLHGHCHDEKTALDLINIRNKQSSNFLKKLSQEWSKVDYLWIDDVPFITSC